MSSPRESKQALFGAVAQAIEAYTSGAVTDKPAFEQLLNNLQTLLERDLEAADDEEDLAPSTGAHRLLASVGLLQA